MDQNQVSSDTERANDQYSRLALTPHAPKESNGTLGPIKPEPVLITVDRRVPLEVWQKICLYLYPSQLSRMSMASTALRDAVASLPSWTILFRRIFGPTKVLWLSPQRLESKSYMLYICACSSMVCEQCYKYYERLPSINTATLPLPVRVESYRQDYKSIELLGCPVDPGWTLQLCLQCRRNHYTVFREDTTSIAKNSHIAKDVVKQKYYLRVGNYPLLVKRTVDSNKVEYLESSVVEFARKEYGGDVGIQAKAGSVTERFERSNCRIMGYSHLAGPRWTIGDGYKSCE